LVKCDDKSQCGSDSVIEVLKYLQMDNEKEKKNKKSKKSSKRKYNSDFSDNEKTPKKSKLVDGCSKPKINDKKKKSKRKKSIERKSVDSVEYNMTKKKSKKKSKTTDASETEDIEGLNQNTSKNDSVQFFELRPNEWNINKKSSMRGVIHHSEVKNKNKTSPAHNTSRCDKNIRKKNSNSLNLIDKKLRPITNRSKNKSEMSKLSDVFEEHVGENEKRKKQLHKAVENIKSDKIDDVSKDIINEKKISIGFKNSDSESNEKKKCVKENSEMLMKSVDECHNDIFKHKNDVQQIELLKKDNSEQQDRDKDLNSILKPQTQSISLGLYDKLPITCHMIEPVTEAISYRDKVKMNLKKLSTCQDIPFVFGFSSPIRLIKSQDLKLENLKDFKVTKEQAKSYEDKSKAVDKTKLLTSDEPKVIVFPQTQMNESNVTNKELPKTNSETFNKEIDHSYDWDDSEESDTEQSLVTSTNTSEYSSNERESEQINSNLLKNDLPNRCNLIGTLSNDSEFKELEELTSDVFETNSSLGSKRNEQKLPLEVNNVVIEKDINTLPNLADCSEQNVDCNTVGLQNDVVNVKIEKIDSDSIYSPKSSIDLLEVSKSNNELITQWTSDWINLDKSVNEISYSNNSKSGDEELQLKKKSRWDKQPKDNKISRLQSLNNTQEKDKNETETSILTDKLKHSSSPSNNEYDLYDEQNQPCEIMSINCMNDFSEINPYVYDDYSQTYEQYTGIPMYSEMKTIEHDLLSPIDYSVYENYNPNYHTEDYDMWKSVDTSESEMIKSIPTTDETVSQVRRLTINFIYVY